ncbi:MAG TPA: hypothetical protein VLB27_04745, partial [candidate division Zixibacteria bacterium]|nr:hypothetical protein [candidate division Zixibacteria bacterium]
LSLIFANESPRLINPRIANRYNPGSEGAPGFYVGAGGEYFFTNRHAVTLDAQVRFAHFSYARNARFNFVGVWVAAGVLITTR